MSSVYVNRKQQDRHTDLIRGRKPGRSIGYVESDCRSSLLLLNSRPALPVVEDPLCR